MKVFEAISSLFFVSGIIIAVSLKNWRCFLACLSVSLLIVLWSSPQYGLSEKITSTLFIIGITGFVFVKRYLKVKKYRESEYFKQTGTELNDVDSNKGGYGEYLISNILEAFEGEEFRTLYNLYIPKSDGNTTEIDSLCITRSGLIVIESKNYSGWIFGNLSQKNWMQTIYGDRSYFYNPVLQNNGHIKELVEYTGLSLDKMVSIIVFSERCALKQIPENIPGELYIIKRNKLNETVQLILETKKDLLSNEQILDVYQKLVPCIRKSEEVKQAHIESVQTIH